MVPLGTYVISSVCLSPKYMVQDACELLYEYFRFQYCLERMAPQYHTFMTMFGMTFSSGIGIMFLSLIGYICNSWVQCLIAIGLVNLLSIGAVAPIPRSFRWYFSRKSVLSFSQLIKFCINSVKSKRENNRLKNSARQQTTPTTRIKSTKYFNMKKK